MTDAWQWIKGHTEWVYLVLMLFITGWSFASGDTGTGIFDVVVTVIVFSVLLWVKRDRTPTAPVPLEVPLELEAAEAVLTEPPAGLAVHLADNPDCSLCKGMGWTK